MEAPVDLPTIKQMLREEVLPLFSASERDVAKVTSLKETLNTTTSLRNQRESDAKKIIEELTSCVSSQEKEIHSFNDDSQPTIQELEQQLQSLQNEQDLLAKRKAELHDIISDKVDYESTVSEQQRLKRKRAEEQLVPVLRTHLALYENITRLSWNYNDEQSISGYVAYDDQCKSFAVNPQLSAPEIADSLWGVIADVLI
ncbi:hypothetical protein P9112_003367 [Eukaryota sp. TZLM1-RC]